MSEPAAATDAAIDVGQSTLRVRLRGVGATDGDLVVVPRDPSTLAPVTERAIAELCDEITDALPAGRFGRVAIGVSGFDLNTNAPQELLLNTIDARLDALVVRVVSDKITGYLGALGLIPGVVLTWGTGAVAVGVGEDLTFVEVDGRGPLLGDVGSGYWIGRRGLVAGLDDHDGRAAAPNLGRLVIQRFGSPAAAFAAVYADPNPTSTIADFARTVIAAATAGDPVADAIVVEAAVEVARSVVAAARRAGLSPSSSVRVVGGIAESPLALDALAKALAAEGCDDVIAVAGAALAGSELLAAVDELPAPLRGCVAEVRR